MNEMRTGLIAVIGSFIKVLFVLGWGAMLIFALFFLWSLDWNIYFKILLGLWFIELGVHRIYKMLMVSTADLEEALNKKNL